MVYLYVNAEIPNPNLFGHSLIWGSVKEHCEAKADMVPVNWSKIVTYYLTGIATENYAR